jgi:hypothetical protein
VRWPPVCEDVNPGEKERPQLEDVTQQLSEDRDPGHQSMCDSDTYIKFSHDTQEAEA